MYYSLTVVAECFRGAADGLEDQVRAGLPHRVATGETDHDADDNVSVTHTF